MNENAIVLCTVNCITSSPVPAMPLSPKAIDRDMPHFHYDTISILLEDGPDFEAISGLFHDMATGKYGDIIRAKALVNTLQGPYKFDLSFANVHCVPFTKEVVASRLVVIGKDLHKEALYSAFTIGPPASQSENGSSRNWFEHLHPLFAPFVISGSTV